MSNKIREIPIGSGLCVAWGLAALSGRPAILGTLMLTSPLLCGTMAIPAAVDLFSGDRSRLSKAFSVAAAGVSIIGGTLPFLVDGPDALGTLLISGIAAPIAGALNVAAYLTRNTRMPWAISIEKSEAKAQPPASSGVP